MDHSVINHDLYDERAYQEVKAMSPKIYEAIKNTGFMETAEATIRDIFFSLYKSSPHIQEKTHSLSSLVQKEIMEQVMLTREYQDIRHNTVGDPLFSAIATVGIAESVINGLGDDIKKRLNYLSAAEEKADELFKQAATLEQLMKERPDLIEKLEQQAKEAQKKGEQFQKKAIAAAAQLEQQSEDIGDAARIAARNSITKAEEEIEEIQDALRTYAGGNMLGGTGESGAKMTIKEKLALATKVGQSDKLKHVAELCGRMINIAMRVQKTKVDLPPDTIVGITTGNDLSHILSSELALLTDPDLEDLFYKRLIESNLGQYDMKGSEKQGRGPIIVALDSSGSMTGYLGSETTKEEWSKAVMLALLAIAKKEKRDFAALHFSGSSKQMKQFFFSKGEASPQDLIRTTEHFFGGFTEYDTWMHTALKLTEESRFNKADVICVSDGDVYIPEELEKEWNRRRKAKEMRSYGVLLGDENGERELRRVCDDVATIDDLKQDTSALEMMFSV